MLVTGLENHISSTEILSVVVVPSLATDSTLPVLVKVGHVTPYTQFEKYGVLLSDIH